DEYKHCLPEEGKLVTTDLNVENGTATACINPSEDCEVSDFALVSYSAPGDSWNSGTADQQEIWDTDESGDADGCFSVDIPSED
ncbi:MAG: hypothetical protein R6V31_02575, partial [Halohasta sp.]